MHYHASMQLFMHLLCLHAFLHEKDMTGKLHPVQLSICNQAVHLVTWEGQGCQKHPMAKQAQASHEWHIDAE